MTKNVLFLILAAFATNACARTEQPRDPSNVEGAEQAADSVATTDVAKPADKQSASNNGQIMDEATRATFRGVNTKSGAKP